MRESTTEADTEAEAEAEVKLPPPERRARPPCPKCGGFVARSREDPTEIVCFTCGRRVYLDPDGGRYVVPARVREGNPPEKVGYLPKPQTSVA